MTKQNTPNGKNENLGTCTGYAYPILYDLLMIELQDSLWIITRSAPPSRSTALLLVTPKNQLPARGSAKQGLGSCQSNIVENHRG